MRTDLKPLFIFSLPRSGSTLLQRILAASGQVSTAAEPWLLLPLLYTLKSEGVRAEYWHRQACSAIEDFYSGLPNGKKDYLDEMRMFILNLYRKRSSPESRYFLDKTPRYNLICDEIMNLFPEGRFIFLWRNPLAVVSSIVNSWYGGQWKATIYSIDLYDGLKRLIDAFESHRPVVHSLRYESLLSAPSTEIQNLFDYLELDYDDRILTSFKEICLAGRMGDKVGVKKYDALNRSSVNAWTNTFHNPFRRYWAERYLKWIGTRNLRAMGYEYADLKTELHKGKTLSGGQLFSDMALAFFLSIRKAQSPFKTADRRYSGHLYT